jgi:hypothetical protein
MEQAQSAIQSEQAPRELWGEAATVFSDALARIFPDEDHSIEEQREIIIGHSSRRRLLLVSFTEVAANRVRIISARRVTRGEQRDYEENIPN